MIVLQVCAYAARYGGNFIASLTALENDLNRKGIETRYLFPDTTKDMQWCQELQGRTKVYFAGLNRFSHATYNQVKAAMENADIIHSHFELYDCITAIARKKKQKLFWHLHDSFDETIDLPHRIINRMQYKYLGRQAILIAPNKFYSDYVVRLGFDCNRVNLVNNCIDTERLNIQPDTLKQFDFFAFGGFYYVKGLDILLDACRLLSARNSNWKLGIVGYEDTWKWMDKNYSDLDSHIERLHPNENVSYFYNRTSVFICTSRRENFPYALLETLYMEKPAIVSSIPGTQWALKYKTVKVVQSENAEDLANVMEQYLLGEYWFSQDDLRFTSSDIKDNYNITGWIPEIERVYFDG